MTGVRKVRMRTYLRTARTLSDVLRRGARPRLSGGAHGAQTHRSMRTPSAHPLGFIAHDVLGVDAGRVEDAMRALCDEVDRLRAENTALRSLVARFYTQAWEDPLTDDEMALLDPIVNAAVEEADRG